MDNKTLRKVQSTELEIAKEFKKICEENNLIYIMESGTLLGAVRHKGFIPWDDDMDFSMPREDYEKFFKIMESNKNNKYEAINWKITKSYPHPFGKFVKRNTVFRESKMDESFGIYIDIFPWDNWPDNKIEGFILKNRLRIIRAIIRAKCGCRTYVLDDRIDILKLIKNIPFICLSFLFSKDYLVTRYEKYCTKHNTQSTKEIAMQCPDIIGNWNLKNNLFESRIELLFENELFKAPYNYDGLLRKYYGDYMTPPPENMRGNQHMIVELDFGDEEHENSIK